MPRTRKTAEKTDEPKGNTQTEKGATPHQLYRSQTNRVFAGVAGGLGEYFGVDPTLVRLIFILIALFAHGFGVLLYIALWILIPEKGQDNQNPHETIRANIAAMHNNFKNIHMHDTHRRYVVLGILLLLVGLLFLSDTTGFFYAASFHLIWPFVLILIGIALLIRW